jgi:hypothetical protein
MHLVFLNQYYPPDAAPTGVMLAAVVEELAAQGHAVTVICAEGGYAGGRHKTSRPKTQDEENEGGFVAAIQSEHLRALKQTRSHPGWPKAICDRRSECEAKSIPRSIGTDAQRAPLHSTHERRGAAPPSSPTIDNNALAACSGSENDRAAHPAWPEQSEGKQPTSDNSAPCVRRIRATRFGRGTFVGKVMDYLSYYLGAAWILLWLRPRPQRIVAMTTPPYLSVLARVGSKLRGGDHAHWVMDVYPDVMVAHGMLRVGSLPHRFLSGLARWGFGGKRCAAILTLGPDMAERVAAMAGADLRIGPTCRQRRAEANEPSDPPGGGPAAPDEVGRPGPSDPTWVPLWGGEHRTSNIEQRASKDEGEDHRPSAIHDPRSLRLARGWRDDELVVMYSGNMGLGHRFGEILEVMGKGDGGQGLEVGNVAVVCDRRSEGEGDDPALAGRPAADEVGRPGPSDPTRFVFFGGGKRRGEIERFVAAHPGAAVELHDYAPAEDLGMHLRSADVHLASLAGEWTGTMVPSKLQGIFHAARPVIFIGEAKSSIGRWVAASGGGWLVAPGDVAGLELALEEARDPQVRESRGRAAQAFAAANFDKQANVRRVAEVLACALV